MCYGFNFHEKRVFYVSNLFLFFIMFIFSIVCLYVCCHFLIFTLWPKSSVVVIVRMWPKLVLIVFFFSSLEWDLLWNCHRFLYISICAMPANVVRCFVVLVLFIWLFFSFSFYVFPAGHKNCQFLARNCFIVYTWCFVVVIVVFIKVPVGFFNLQLIMTLFWLCCHSGNSFI